jgi:hypothetical protein
MSKFNELYGYLSDRQTPHLFVIAEILYGIKEAIDVQNQHLSAIASRLDALGNLTPPQETPPQGGESA